VDSPLAAEATRIYSGNLKGYLDEEAISIVQSGDNLFTFPGLTLTRSAEESRALNEDRSSKIIISASGMCDAGRIRHHLKHNLWRADSTILFVGYQSEGTVGRKLLDGATSVRLFGEDIAVNAKICAMSGISGHADRDMLLGWLGHMTQSPTQVFANHGDDEVCDTFAASITEKLGFPAVAPYSGDEYDLMTGQCVAKGVVIKISKVSDGRRRGNAIFDKLLCAGKRLLQVIDQCKGLSNKELARFTDQINALCDKYSKK
jgi:metallo-beta-lactamase family protein